MKRVFTILGALAAIVVLSWFFPLFHVVSRASLQALKEQKTFRAAEYVNDFWQLKLAPALPDAAEVNAVLAALRDDPALARTQFGRTAGLGRSTLYFVQGKGTVVAVEENQVGISLAGPDKAVDVVLPTGLLFGNIARDATGLVSGDDFPNSQQFNEISTELNRTIESTVLPLLKERAKVGDAIEFVGGAEVTNVPADFTPLEVVPLEVKFP